MRNDRHEPDGAEKQRPERIPVDPGHRSLLTQRHRAVAIDPLLQNGRRLEHDHATRRNRRLGAGLRGTADMLTFVEIFRHGSVSLPFQNPRSLGNAHRGIGMRAWFRRLFINTISEFDCRMVVAGNWG
jgi:hypothetical protein